MAKGVDKGKESNGISNELLAFVSKNEGRIKEVSDKFGDYIVDAVPLGPDKAKESIIKWLTNFDRVDFTNYELALTLLERFEFVKSQDIWVRLSVLAKQKELLTQEGTYITHLGEETESSYRLTCHFNQLQNFCGQLTDLLDRIGENEKFKILYFDDFLNSGGQIRTIFYSLMNKPLPSGAINDEWESRTKLSSSQAAKLKNCEIHIFYYTAFDEGIEKVEKEIIQELGINIKIHRHLTANNNDGTFGDHHDQANIRNGSAGRIATPCTFTGMKCCDLTQFYEILKEAGFELLRVNEPKWGEDKWRDRSLGYGNICRLTATDYNIPTVTITALWHEGEITVNGKKIFWSKLLPRKKKKIFKPSSPPAFQNLLSTEGQMTQEVIVNLSAKIRDKMVSRLQETIREFLSLSDANRVKILKELQIYKDAYQTMEPNEALREIFKTISEKNLIEQLWLEVHKIKPFQTSTNPFQHIK